VCLGCTQCPGAPLLPRLAPPPEPDQRWKGDVGVPINGPSCVECLIVKALGVLVVHRFHNQYTTTLLLTFLLANNNEPAKTSRSLTAREASRSLHR